MSSTQEQPIIPKIKYNAILGILSKGFHVDRRPLTSYRPFEVKFNIAPNADSSVLFKLGNTQILAGVKLEVGQPFPDSPNEGVLIVNAEYLPAASPTFEPGPPDENAIELARVIDRGLREAKVIALDKLVIVPGKRVWIVWLDIYILDHDGNLIDASAMASMLALATTFIPYYEVDPLTSNVKIDRTKKLQRLPLNRYVVSVTVNKIGDLLVIDPTGEEEAIASSKLAISISEEGNIVGIQKMGIGYVTEDDINKAIEMALSIGIDNIEKLKKIINQWEQTFLSATQ